MRGGFCFLFFWKSVFLGHPTAHSASCFHYNFVTYSFSLESVRSKVCLQCRESKNRGYDGWLGRRGEGGVTKVRGSRLIVKEARSLAAVQQCAIVQTLSWCARQVRRSLTRRRAKELPSFLNLPFTQRQLAIAKMNTLMKLINANWKPWSPQYRYWPEVGIKVKQQPRNDIIIFLSSKNLYILSWLFSVAKTLEIWGCLLLLSLTAHNTIQRCNCATLLLGSFWWIWK